MENEKQIPILMVGDEFNILQGSFLRRVVIKEIDKFVDVSPSVIPDVIIIAKKI